MNIKDSKPLPTSVPSEKKNFNQIINKTERSA